MKGDKVLQELKAMAIRMIEGSDQNVTAVLPNLSVFRWKEDETFHGVVYKPAVCVVLNGRKDFMLHDKTISHTPGDAFVISHDMPILSRIRGAKQEDPYLSLVLTLDLSVLRTLYDRFGQDLKQDESAKTLYSGPYDQAWAEPLYRYLSLDGKPLEADVMGPLIMTEIHFKLLLSPLGGMLRSLCFVNSKASRISRAINYTKKHFREPMIMSELAKVASMSTSSFFDCFKAVTGKTPLQYQKELRLIEAQNLLSSGEWTVSSAGLEVGYASSSHFSRDYTRKFGCSPKSHMIRARQLADEQ